MSYLLTIVLSSGLTHICLKSDRDLKVAKYVHTTQQRQWIPAHRWEQWIHSKEGPAHKRRSSTDCEALTEDQKFDAQIQDQATRIWMFI